MGLSEECTQGYGGMWLVGGDGGVGVRGWSEGWFVGGRGIGVVGVGSID